MSMEQRALPLTFSREGSHAGTPPWPAVVGDWLANTPGYGGSFRASLVKRLPAGFWLKMSLAFCEPMEGGIWAPSFGTWGSGGMGGPGVCLRLTVSEFPTGAPACLLSAALEDIVPPRYYMSPNALKGVRRRARRRRVGLPPELEDVLP